MGVSNDRFVQYYARESVSPATYERFAGVQGIIRRVLRRLELPAAGLEVLDIGCGAGTQCRMWAAEGHRVHGLDINAELVELARARSREDGLDIDFQVGSATALPWPDGSMDVCISPELLEHVAEWRQCVEEYDRVLKPNGILLLSTTNRLCPVQQEFDLPLYSWYPGFLKRRYERLSVTTRPELVNYTKYPAVNWFTYFELADILKPRGYRTSDRFDVMDLENKGSLARSIVSLVQSSSWIRRLAHVATPYTVIVAVKDRGRQGA